MRIIRVTLEQLNLTQNRWVVQAIDPGQKEPVTLEEFNRALEMLDETKVAMLDKRKEIFTKELNEKTSSNRYGILLSRSK